MFDWWAPYSYMYFTVLITWAISQFIKLPIHFFKTRTLNWNILLSEGRMPSSHTALVVATSTTLTIYFGFENPGAMVSYILTSIVIHDAFQLRAESGKHAKILNIMLEEFHEVKKKVYGGDSPVIKTSIENEFKLKEMMGHTKLEVLVGAIFGIILPLIIIYGFFK